MHIINHSLNMSEELVKRQLFCDLFKVVEGLYFSHFVNSFSSFLVFEHFYILFKKVSHIIN